MKFKELEEKLEKNNITFFHDLITDGDEYYVNFNIYDRCIGIFTPREKEDRKFEYKEEEEFLDEIWKVFKIAYNEDKDVSGTERQFPSLNKYTKKELVE